MSRDESRTLDVIEQERLLLVERLRGLSADDWDRPSLCAGWTVKHVVAHLTTPFTVGLPAMTLAIVRHRGLDRAMDATARRIADRRSSEELVSLLERNAGSAFHPPGMTLAAPLTDAVAHGADIRWAVGDSHADWGDPQRLREVLDFLVGSRAKGSFVSPDRLRDVELVSDDQDWRHGAGAQVLGSSLALVMGVLGREAAQSSLTGDGRALLRR